MFFRMLAVTLLLGARTAQAQENAPIRTELRDAEAQFNMGNYAEALAQFQSLYRRTGKPALLFDIAQCHRQLGDLEKAAINYRSFIRLDPENPGVPIAKE